MEEKDLEKNEQEEITEEIVNDAEQELVTEEEKEEQQSDNKEVQQLKDENDELQNRLLRVQAEYDNFRKRTKKEKEADLKYKSQSIVTELLPVLDNFERALQVEIEDKAAKGVVEGLEIVYRQLKTVLESEGVEAIETDGQIFDPTLHQAVIQVEEEGYESNQIVETMQKGYQLKGRVIRPAMVKVNQ
ncbi:heat shock protein GrpE [Gracilibacillus boraciitolerans JCM 21714]|uniref:Protein GrpE n=1 Tax=Gracilibacillus boraciitolerans JCM 21714 TaxID=1298598 RepID=W4VD81_9BACI|nr:nucleotide exchange factor GrpE [Gracilibacillus boraciitolerans]GAE91136.1 heat shock protein GrpE [Gracilibacillus boraciitolerans JCM 21714]